MRVLLACLAMGALSASAEAAVYKCKDASGKATYSDRPCTAPLPAPIVKAKDDPQADPAAGRKVRGGFMTYGGGRAGSASGAPQNEADVQELIDHREQVRKVAEPAVQMLEQSSGGSQPGEPTRAQAVEAGKKMIEAQKQQ